MDEMLLQVMLELTTLYLNKVLQQEMSARIK
jgi:hypothetical protein